MASFSMRVMRGLLALVCFSSHSLIVYSPVTAFAATANTKHPVQSSRGSRSRHDGSNKSTNNKQVKKQDYEKRRVLWLERYGSLDALKNTFGSAPSFLGDLSPQQTRQLYHTLLPRSLLALQQMGLLEPQELAPLAYEARMAAKQYARSRCVIHARAATVMFDVYRSLRDRKKNNSVKTWDDIWSKYEAQIVQEECQKQLDGKKKKKKASTREDLTMRIYLRILEKSCATNQAFDKLFLKQGNGNEDPILDDISTKLERDIHEILLDPRESAKLMKKTEKMQKRATKKDRKEEKKQRKQEAKEEKRLVKEKEKEAKKKLLKSKQKTEKNQNHKSLKGDEALLRDDDNGTVPVHVSPLKRYELLRILAGTRRKFRRRLLLRNETSNIGRSVKTTAIHNKQRK